MKISKHFLDFEKKETYLQKQQPEFVIGSLFLWMMGFPLMQTAKQNIEILDVGSPGVEDFL